MTGSANAVRKRHRCPDDLAAAKEPESLAAETKEEDEAEDAAPVTSFHLAAETKPEDKAEDAAPVVPLHLAAETKAEEAEHVAAKEPEHIAAPTSLHLAAENKGEDKAELAAENKEEDVAAPTILPDLTAVRKADDVAACKPPFELVAAKKEGNVTASTTPFELVAAPVTPLHLHLAVENKAEDAAQGAKGKVLEETREVSMYDVDPNSLLVPLLPANRSDKGPTKHIPANASMKEVHEAAASLMATHFFNARRRREDAAKEARRARASLAAAKQKTKEQWKARSSFSSAVSSAAPRPCHTIAYTGPSGGVVCRDWVPSTLEMALAGFVPPSRPVDGPGAISSDAASSSSSDESPSPSASGEDSD